MHDNEEINNNLIFQSIDFDGKVFDFHAFRYLGFQKWEGYKYNNELKKWESIICAAGQLFNPR